MPALGDMLLAHAHADPGTNFIAREGGCQKLGASHSRTGVGDGDQGRQGDGPDMKHTLAVNVIEFESLNHGSIDKRRVER